MVLQEPFLFSGTIYDNIRCNKLDATRDQMEEPARAVGADELISTLPSGHDTCLDRAGINLSLGQPALFPSSLQPVSIHFMRLGADCRNRFGLAPTCGKIGRLESRSG